jgi:hypothetical protein
MIYEQFKAFFAILRLNLVIWAFLLDALILYRGFAARAEVFHIKYNYIHLLVIY